MCKRLSNIIKYGELYDHVDSKEAYVHFKEKKEAEQWGMQHYELWALKYKMIMNMAQDVLRGAYANKTVEAYCGYKYREVNTFLRTDEDCDNGTYKEVADILSLAICTAPRIPCDVVLYRMVEDDFIKQLIQCNKKCNPVPVLEKGFMSTSLLKRIAFEDNRNNLLKIYVKKNTCGIYVNAVAKRGEEEMLLLPNMFLRLIEYPYLDEESGKTIYECKLIDMNARRCMV